MTEQDPTEAIDEAPEDTGEADRIAALEAEVSAAKDQHLRALAEQENIRRRAQREREDAVKYAAANFAKDLIATADNLRRALDAVKEAELADDVSRNLLTGVAAIERELLASFDRNGIKRIDPMGEKFDHNFHQALFEIENTGKPAGTVVQVLVPGYVIHDRLLRAAMVGVAKGDGKAPEPAPGDAADGRRRIDTTV